MNVGRIRLGGKYAVGEHAYALVDEDMLPALTRHAWKAKPNANGTHVYAVRNSVVGGRNVTIRMHRAVLGYEGPLDVDHKNQNTLDNRRENLRAVPRLVNVKNTGKRHFIEGPYSVWPKPDPYVRPQVIGVGKCGHCNRIYFKSAWHQRYCSEAHKEADRRKVGPLRIACVVCGAGVITRYTARRTCSSSCKNKLRRMEIKQGTSRLDALRVPMEREPARNTGENCC